MALSMRREGQILAAACRVKQVAADVVVSGRAVNVEAGVELAAVSFPEEEFWKQEWRRKCIEIGAGAFRAVRLGRLKPGCECCWWRPGCNEAGVLRPLQLDVRRFPLRIRGARRQ